MRRHYLLMRLIPAHSLSTMDSNVEQGFWNPALTSINPQDLSFSSNPAHHDQKLPGQLAYDYSTTGMDLPTFQANSSANRALSAEQQAVVNEELNVVHPGDGNGHNGALSFSNMSKCDVHIIVQRLTCASV